ncbi:MAG: 4-(cytidine 5'-diphospho)-2-C-methyl-D-erythritol kinase [Muribaculaceae bacterium]|nr:4-(cytidine 5'-diphospho)-2-C-methyl-D-erythritol kinase [Muribaculaceae bacterium]
MVVFPNAKINIGLRVLRKRSDGYHDIESLFVPVGWCDILEIVPAKSPTGSFTLTGSTLGGCPQEKNLVIKAIKALEKYLEKSLPPLDIHLHKAIPDGAGLGGGSADASFALKCVNDIFELALPTEVLASIAATVGADCPFFIYNSPMLVEGIGDILSPVNVPQLNGLAIAIVKPTAEAVSTKEAYQGITPHEMPDGLKLIDLLSRPIPEWHSCGIVNDFEPSIFALRPQIKHTLNKLSQCSGSLYSAMSGSGAAVYALFESVNLAEEAISQFKDFQCFVTQINF